MKNLKKYLIIGSFAVMLTAAGCSTPDGSREDYFGYNNHPKQRETPVPEKSGYAASTESNDGWSNPLADEYEDNVLVVHDAQPRQFVRVIVPWWSYAYAYPPTLYVYASSWNYYPWYYDAYWYSPWYDYHPYYGITWSDYHHHHHYWYHDYGHWGGYPHYTDSYDRPKRENKRRDFGPSRDGYTTVSGGSVNSRTVTSVGSTDNSSNGTRNGSRRTGSTNVSSPSGGGRIESTRSSGSSSGESRSTSGTSSDRGTYSAPSSGSSSAPASSSERSGRIRNEGSSSGSSSSGNSGGRSSGGSSNSGSSNSGSSSSGERNGSRRTK